MRDEARPGLASECFDTEGWFDSKGRGRVNDCISLLRRCLGEVLADFRIGFDGKTQVHYFWARKGRRLRQVPFRNRRQMKPTHRREAVREEGRGRRLPPSRRIHGGVSPLRQLPVPYPTCPPRGPRPDPPLAWHLVEALIQAAVDLQGDA